MDVGPSISKDLCGNCKECVTICPYDVFGEEGDTVAVRHPEECIECLACVDSCPRKAIAMDD